MNYENQMKSIQQKNHRPILEIWRKLQERDTKINNRRSSTDQIEK